MQRVDHHILIVNQGASSSMPRHYVFVKKGNIYVTRHCRQRTLAAGEELYVVRDNKQRVLGLRCPAYIASEVYRDNAATESTREAAVAAKDQKESETARQALLQLFPRMPKTDADKIVSHAFKKRSKRVGRAGNMPVDEKVFLAAYAHARHEHTNYNEIVPSNVLGKRKARIEVEPKVQQLLSSWRAQGADPAARPNRTTTKEDYETLSSDSDYENETTPSSAAAVAEPERRLRSNVNYAVQSTAVAEPKRHLRSGKLERLRSRNNDSAVQSIAADTGRKRSREDSSNVLSGEVSKVKKKRKKSKAEIAPVHEAPAFRPSMSDSVEPHHTELPSSFDIPNESRKHKMSIIAVAPCNHTASGTKIEELYSANASAASVTQRIKFEAKHEEKAIRSLRLEEESFLNALAGLSSLLGTIDESIAARVTCRQEKRLMTAITKANRAESMHAKSVEGLIACCDIHQRSLVSSPYISPWGIQPSLGGNPAFQTINLRGPKVLRAFKDRKSQIRGS